MPWRESSVEQERIRFVILASREGRNFAALCAEFGVSRQTGYTWLRRYQRGGMEDVVERSRRPARSPRRTAAGIEQAIVALRERYPDWGAPKLHALLSKSHPEAKVAVRTVHRVLDRHGLILEQDRHQSAVQRFERAAPNELWQMDFKGPGGVRARCEVGPLSVLDDHSRYLLRLEQVGNTRIAGVRRALQATFEQCGVPGAMLMDHGTPWWNAASPWGWTELSVWLMRQGIQLLFSGVRHPQTQGKIERMHGALARATRRRGADLLKQEWLDLFREEYNHLRPHAALHMATPASRWRASPRHFDPAPREWVYSPEAEVLRLGGQGQLWWRGRRWEISWALRGQRVGLEVAGERAIVSYCRTPLRELHPQTGRSLPLRVHVFG